MNERKIPSAFLAIAVHLILLAVLVFGFRWQAAAPVALEAQIWHDLPAPPETPVAVKKPAPEPEKQPPPSPPQEVARPDPEIALRKAREQREEALRQDELRKQEEKQKEEKLKEERQKEEQQKEERLKEEKQKEEKQKEARKLEQQKAQKLAEQKAQQAKKKMAEQADALMRKVAEQEAAARTGVLDKYKAMIMSRIRRFVVVPPDMKGNPEAVFDVVLLPDGEVLRVTRISSSGVPAYDDAVERAIRRASPLPLPPDPSLFGDFRDLKLTFRPVE